MTVHCSKCQKPFTSLIIDPPLALKEVSQRLFAHALEEHREQFHKTGTTVQLMSMLLGWFISFQEFANVPSDETWLYNEIDKNQDTLAQVIGLDPELENEEDKKEPSKIITLPN